MSGILSLLTAPFTRGPRRPLSQRRPEAQGGRRERDVPLGFEAIDMDVVDEATRRNEAAERSSRMFSRGLHSHIERARTRIAPMPEDETYAARFHRAFQTKKDKS